jgi:hypothetical protein
MDASAARWLGAVARDHYWRVAAWYDLEDLLQDGLLCWQIVVVRYPEATTIQHRMKLFKTTFLNHIHQLANRRSANAPEMAVEDPLGHHQAVEPRDPDTYDMQQLLDAAPPLLRRCLAAILANPKLLARPHRRWIKGRRETTNEWLAGMIGIDPSSVNLHAQLRELLGKT